MTAGSQFVVEFIFSMVVLIVAYGTAFNVKQGEIFGPVLAPLFIGTAISIGIFSSGTLISTGYSGAAMNPARCFGPAAISGTSASFDGHWAYWVGPFCAGAVNAAVYAIAPPHHKDLYEKEAKKATRGRRLP
mmetsp:Transcript_6139/g.22579  ORF Transcript_6139/g.22579 Transcript_6139/m.22579 type:complete len:132 (+) Transcript_6139:769-1164(+)